MRPVSNRYKKWGIAFFFIGFLCIGLLIYKDYGISWDEYQQRSIGIHARDYIQLGDKSFLEFKDRFYGPAFEMLLVGFESIFYPQGDLRDIFFLRHLLNFLTFFVSTIAFYKLGRIRFGSRSTAILGTAFLILSPRIFAHSFYNSKDLILMSFFILGIYTLIQFLDRKTLFTLINHAAVTAFLIDIRLIGFLVTGLTIFFAILNGFYEKSRTDKRHPWPWLRLLTFASLSFGFLIFFSPFLWSHPLGNLFQSLKYFTAFPETYNVLYWGQVYPSDALPWHYIPAWMILTSPVIYSLFFFAGIFFLFGSLFRSLRSLKTFYGTHRNDLIFMTWFFIPLFYVIISHQNLYTGWRHMFFIYPAFLLIALTGFTQCAAWIKQRFPVTICKAGLTILFLLIAVSCISTLGWMVKNHPYQQVYFNRLAGKDMREIKSNFVLDYWGLSYRELLEYILARDRRQKINILPANLPAALNPLILPPEDRERIAIVTDFSTADYFLSNYHWHPNEYPLSNEFTHVAVGNAKISAAYKLTETERLKWQRK